jgi:hypothetical protein
MIGAILAPPNKCKRSSLLISAALVAVSPLHGCQRGPRIENLAIPKHNCTNP